MGAPMWVCPQGIRRYQKLNGVEKVTFFWTTSLFETGVIEELDVLAGIPFPVKGSTKMEPVLLAKLSSK
ncbi:TPA: hypothetical protein ACN7LE_005863, partial [Klebsiella pneumoniae]